MARIARAVAAGLPHHVTQRGTNQQQVFLDSQDRIVYLRLIREYAERYHLGFWGYCLMPNHTHLVVVPDDDHALARAFGMAHAAYARYFHAKHGGCGHLWQSRFFSCVMNESHAWWALAYVESNPVRAGLVQHAADWKWSSARAHVGLEPSALQLAAGEWSDRYGPRRWRTVLETDIRQEAMIERFRKATRTGRPLGDQAFIESLEQATQRDLRPKKRGPIPKTHLRVEVSLGVS